MHIIRHGVNNSVISEIDDVSLVLRGTQDLLDLFVTPGIEKRIILKSTNLSLDFFDLRTGLAGEMLQKLVNYQVRLAIVGDFSQYTSEAMQAFIREANRGRDFYFVSSIEEAFRRFSGT